MKIIFLRKRNIIYFCMALVLLIVIYFGARYILTYKNTPTLQMDPIYQGKTDKPHVAITINVDWGEEIIPKMLDVLKNKNVQATFFITGRFAEKFPEIVKRIKDAGQEIGNHGFSHPHPDQLSVAKNKEEIQKTHDILKKITNESTFLFAPPYGERGENCLKAAEATGHKTILWTADTIDWQEPPPSVNTLVNRVTDKKLTNGAIILMHPKSHTLKALPIIIDVIKSKGYQIKKVSEII